MCVCVGGAATFHSGHLKGAWGGGGVGVREEGCVRSKLCGEEREREGEREREDEKEKQ